MNSQTPGTLFSNLFSQQSLPIIVIILAVLLLVVFFLFIYEHRRISKLLRGSNTLTIEDSILELAKELDTLSDFKEESEQYLELVEKRLRKSVQAIETHRFNPFKGSGTGGNQSFACVFLNENGDGLILSSLYSSDRMSVYAKPVQKFVSTFELTEEETQALETAKDRLVI